ncbi:DUF6529 family protein [Nocardia crassostreae]|uniref:DUF6529 family protein n=1 Tax=Nocardia crassostreae TaxID=53428 RepID=UPI00082EAFAF|nr:DUF6529 family protein [Nocardia crassostreae]
MTAISEPTPRESAPRAAALTIALIVLAGAATSIALGVYASTHEPRGYAVSLAGFSSPGAVKSWMATVVVVLALGQVVSALVMYGQIPGIRGGRWTSVLHVWSGRIAVLVSVPVAVHCFYAFGFEDYTTRVLWHSLLGCLVYGIFVTKMLLLTRKGLPGWALPVAGGLLFTGFAGLWFTSAVWYFRVKGFGS